MPLSWSEIRDRAVAFSREYRTAQSEKSLSQQFWRDFFHVFGIDAKRVASFEQQVKLTRVGETLEKSRNGWIDVFWRGRLLIEMKSAGQNLDRAFAQALQYFDNLHNSGLKERDLPRHILVCDFQNFRLFDVETGTEQRFTLADLPKRIKAFGFVAGYQVQTIEPQDPVNVRAAKCMRELHNALKVAGYGGHDLRVLLVRTLFCLFADDTGIFQPAGSFKELLDQQDDPATVGRQLVELFEVLNTLETRRQRAHQDNYAPFRYINGKLFEERIATPAFDHAAREALLDAAALDWSRISPAIFGAMFQDVMSSKERRDVGAHYTSEANIQKLIKPLFLDALWAEFQRVKGQRNRLFEFHKKLRGLTFFDPACGCGNFLVVTYRELRRLELEILRTAHNSGQQMLDVHELTSIDVDQFYGIEIEEFPAQIAQVALWLTDHQMNTVLSDEFGQYFARLPLTSTPHIVHGNALQLDWAGVLPPTRCSYILGNPPFVGAKYMADAQRADVATVFAGIGNAGQLDFVAAWYVKAARYMKADRAETPPVQAKPNAVRAAPNPVRAELVEAGHPSPKAAFVSTNSITQGEQVGVLWGWLLAQGVRIHFAHRTFKWGNEASGKAAVHCVIIGFGLGDAPGKTIFDYDDIAGEPHAVAVGNINPYLVDGPDVVLPRRSQPICAVPEIRFGNQPIDGGHLILETAEAQTLRDRYPQLQPYIRLFLGADEFINGGERFCLWLKGCPPSVLRAIPEVVVRLAAVKKFRSESKREATRALAASPAEFAFVSHTEEPYIVVPSVSSERRQFVPMGFAQSSLVVSNLCLAIPGGTLFHFGILSSTMHNAWMRFTCGRLKSDYRYSNSIVYNNFPWPEALLNSPANNSTKKQPNPETERPREAIETAASDVLQARAKHPESSLADLYDPLTMPPDLRKAHLRKH